MLLFQSKTIELFLKVPNGNKMYITHIKQWQIEYAIRIWRINEIPINLFFLSIFFFLQNIVPTIQILSHFQCNFKKTQQ